MIRVSRERDGMTSPEVQRHAIESYAASNGIDIVDWVEGIDETGSRARSAWWPRLDQSIERLEAGEFEVIVVWKFSRTARHRLRWAVALDRVDALGGGLLSATEPIDDRTSHGRLARGMVGEFNAYQADLIGDTWREAHARRFREGKPINGKPRFGYAYSPADGFVPDPITGAVLAETYRRYISGESVYALVRWLNSGPTRPVGGYGGSGDGLWSERTLRRVLDSGFAAGMITYQGEQKRGVHERLITDAEWDAYLEARGRRRVYRRSERSTYAFSGMVWCTCGSKMHGGTHGQDRAQSYRCKDGKEKGTHDGGYVAESLIDDAVRGWLREHEARVRAEIRAGIERRPRRVGTDPTADLKRQLADIANRQVILAEQRLTMGMPQAAYETLRDRYAAQAVALEQELRTTEVQQSAPLRVLPVLLERWNDLTVEERREYLRSLIARIEVTPGRPRARVEIVPHES
ncbi:recombinase family protein [Microbacterium sp. LB12]|uniref:recombinase family protein n=2 Tax=unclassified Microbacterium TaxID=2609290 RepID=UPI003019CDF9